MMKGMTHIPDDWVFVGDLEKAVQGYAVLVRVFPDGLIYCF